MNGARRPMRYDRAAERRWSFSFCSSCWALLLFGPRKGGRRPGRLAMAAGALFLLWFVVAVLLGWSWRAFFGDLPQP